VAGVTRRYDKGERRLKHVGSTAAAEILFEAGNPRKVIGKCPNTVEPAKRQELLESAIPGPNGDRVLNVAKSLYAIYEGVIYEAQTSDAGVSYHAYPYHGPLNGRLIKALRPMAKESGFESEFEAWVKVHIIPRGSWR
jgi:hypothetical protein